MQGAIQNALIRRPLPQHEGKIDFSGLAFAELVLQTFQGTAFFGYQQNATGFAVKAVHQFQKLRFGACHAKLFDHPKTHPRTTVYGNASGFIDGNEVVIFKQNGKIPRWNRMVLCHHRSHCLRFFGSAF